MYKAIKWFIENPVTANLIAIIIIAGGLILFKNRVVVELFPDVSASTVIVSTAVNGATPDEVETGVTIVVEDAIREIEGIDDVYSTSRENNSRVAIDISIGQDANLLLDIIRNKVNAINQFPDNAEKPVVELQTRLRGVGDIAISDISGNFSERELRDMAERIRNELKNILQSQVQIETKGFRRPEINISIKQDTLIAHNLTFDQITQAINNHSIDLSTGTIKSSQQELIMSSKARIRNVADLENVVIKRSDNGSPLYLRDISEDISDSYADDSYQITYQGRPSLTLEIFRIANGNVIQVMRRVHQYVDNEVSSWLPDGAEVSIIDDDSKVVQSRIDLLISNAIQGGLFIVFLLVLFLRPVIAMWVLFGMVVSVSGGFLMMGLLGTTLNMITLFAFIMVLGIVVDDATVIAENIYSHVLRGDGNKYSILEGTYEVAIPVTFGMLTTVAAFSGIFFVEGRVGQVMSQLPLIVVPVLFFSFFESKFILPTHLRHLNINQSNTTFVGKFLTWQANFSNGFIKLIEKYYRPLIKTIIKWRYAFLVVFLGSVILIFATLPLGYLRFIFFPNIERDTIVTTINMEVGTPFAQTQKFVEQIVDIASEIREDLKYPGSNESPIKHIVSTAGNASGDSHVARVVIELEAPEIRRVKLNVRDLVKQIRRKIVEPPSLANIGFRAVIGLRGSPISYYLSHENRNIARQALVELQNFLQNQPFVYDVKSDLSLVKEELILQPKPELESSGITLREVVRQIRGYFYGVEIDRFYRQRDEVSIIIRLPEHARKNLEDVSALQVRTASGSWLRLSDIVSFQRYSATNVNRRNKFLSVLSIESNYDKEQGNLQTSNQTIESYIQTLVNKYPGLDFQRGGETVEQKKTLSSMPVIIFFVLALLYFLIAIPTRSYIYPFIVIATLPFAISGALFGHIILSQPLTMPSTLGMLAMLGVAVNSAIILVVFINRECARGVDINIAITESGINRFRAVFLTSATTMAGLMPLMLEKSIQAQFLIPVAISMVFGVGASAMATLIVVPLLYKIIDDLKFSSK